MYYYLICLLQKVRLMNMSDIHFGVKIPRELKKAVVNYCIKEGTKVKTFVKNALMAKLEKDGRYEQKAHRMD